MHATCYDFPVNATLRILGAGHLVVAAALLPISRAPGFDTAPLLLVVPVWFALLGLWLFRPSETLRRALRATHIVAAPFAVWICAYGVFALRSEEEGIAAAALPFEFAWFPVVAGILAAVLSVSSLALLRVWPAEPPA